MANLGELRADLNQLVSDPTDERWSAATKNTALNKGYRKLASRVKLPSLKATWTLAWTASTASFALSAAVPLTSTIRLVKSVYWGTKIPEHKLSPLTEEQWDELDQTTTSDTPRCYYIRNTTIFLWPIPTAAATVNINGWQRCVDMAEDTDEPLVHEDYHDYIPFHAAWKLLLMDKSPDDIPLAREYRSEFREGFEEITSFHEDMTEEDDRPDQVFDTFDGDSDTWGSL